MANTKVASELKVARDAWNAIRTTSASATDKHKVKEAYARCAVRHAEETLGEKVLRAGRRLTIR